MSDTLTFETEEFEATDYGLVLFDTSSSMNTVREAEGTDYGMLLFDTSSSMNTTEAADTDWMIG